MAEKVGTLSFSELEEFSLDIQRRIALSKPEGDIKTIVNKRLLQWQARAKVTVPPGE